LGGIVTTLAELLGGDTEPCRADLASALHDQADRQHSPLLAQPVIAGVLAAGFLARLQEESLADFVANAWEKLSDVDEACKSTRDGPNDPVVVCLARRKIVATNRLRVEIEHVEQPALEPSFTVEVELGSGTLTIEQGRITRIQPISAKASAQLCLGKVVLASCEPIDVSLELDIADVREQPSGVVS
jgi:hypothetical protein